MKEQNAIEVKNLKKSFKVYLDKSNSFKEKVIFKKRNRFEERAVLKGISFEVKKGEAIGLVGHNGCGKSTTLKLLTRIMYPDSGTVELKGRVSSLIELGAGFHPDMSGRENIYINASIFGLSRKEIDARMADIIEFSELEDYIDNPVRTYSSGMYMRLAFSVAINVSADILLIDEILAVGDVNFQAKCFSKLHEIKKNGTTIVIVSHSMDQIEKICSRSIWIDSGEIKMDGKPRDVHNAYLEHMSEMRRLQIEEEEKRSEAHKPDDSKNAESNSEEKSDASKNDNGNKPEKSQRRGTGEARISDVKILDEKGQPLSLVKDSDYIKLEISYKVNKPVEDAIFGLCIIREDGVRCFGCNSLVSYQMEKNLTEDGKVTLWIENRFLSGIYYVDATIEDSMRNTIDYYDNCLKFEVNSMEKIDGVTWVKHKWQF
ncbi:ABC-2 type transport system ATP-binding protein [Pseudobutyrivibrio sp. ACV-2]|uniref:ABC transporter ATP-binding protein n=1 Tax=Pseudobutyrivibrio sp. ACV-2 TaxID=1520801 RepID=UPI00089C2C1D|nr:ABC transporter ATP-binding protein [Pseudobutyrivibrio sp. ACV-2]SEB00544.1 ABC-2 type transport system ATP-binding protein [Pseudobutyrivibrio sp. ACV-2]